MVVCGFIMRFAEYYLLGGQSRIGRLYPLRSITESHMSSLPGIYAMRSRIHVSPVIQRRQTRKHVRIWRVRRGRYAEVEPLVTDRNAHAKIKVGRSLAANAARRSGSRHGAGQVPVGHTADVDVHTHGERRHIVVEKGRRGLLRGRRELSFDVSVQTDGGLGR